MGWATTFSNKVSYGKSHYICSKFLIGNKTCDKPYKIQENGYWTFTDIGFVMFRFVTISIMTKLLRIFYYISVNVRQLHTS